MITDKQVDSSRHISIDKMPGENEEDTWLLHGMAEEAKLFLLSSKRCKAIQDGWLGWCVGGVAAAFLFEVVPDSGSVDQLLWVIVGDLPPAYLVVDDETWINAVPEGRYMHDCIPLIIPATGENASALQTRLDFIKQQFLDDRRALTGDFAPKPSVQ